MAIAEQVSRSRGLFLPPSRKVTAAEAAAPTGDAGWDVQDYDQVLIVVNGNADGVADFQLWRRFEVPQDTLVTKADTWFPGELIRGAMLYAQTELYRSGAVFLVNTLGCDRIQCLLDRKLGDATTIYIAALGVTKVGEPLIEGSITPAFGGTPPLLGSKIDLFSTAGAAKALTTSYVAGNWIPIPGATEIDIICAQSTNTATSVLIYPAFSVDGGTTPVRLLAVDEINLGVESVSLRSLTISGAPATYLVHYELPRAGHFTIYVKYSGGSAPNFLATALLGRVSL